jgi:nucleoside-diphosphate-sugar epimerase
MNSDFEGPINIGSEEMVSISEMVEMVANIANKKINQKFMLDAPIGVRGRNSNNSLIRQKLNWDYSMKLSEGLSKTYDWINHQLTISRI